MTYEKLDQRATLLTLITGMAFIVTLMAWVIDAGALCDVIMLIGFGTMIMAALGLANDLYSCGYRLEVKFD